MSKLRAILLLTVLWTSPHSIMVRWDGPGCVYRNQTLIACYPREASYTLEVGGASTDWRYRPAVGDVYRLVRADGQTETATLGARPVYVAWVGR